MIMKFEIILLSLCLSLLIDLTHGLLTDSERKEFVDIHNYLRRSVVPESSDMQEMVYDINIESSVYEYLELCKFEHRKKDGYGENGRLATDGNITNSVVSWFQERVYFDITLPYGDPKSCSKDNSGIDYLGEVQCGHYIMMVKSDLASLGCGYKLCNSVTVGSETIINNYITFCFYKTGQKNPPYEIGKACLSCNEGYGFCYNNLCVKNNAYDKSKVECKLTCKNCALRFGYPQNCLCVCPEGTGAGCTGQPKEPNVNCSNCQKISENCQNGGKEITSSTKCQCSCAEGYQGTFCEVKKDQYDNSYEHLIEGLPWRYNMTTPANIIQFKVSFNDFQRTILKDVYDLCSTRNSTALGDMGNNCKEISGQTISPENVQLISGYPALAKNGSLKIRIFINFTYSTGNPKEVKFVSPKIIEQVWKTPSTRLNELIGDVRQIYPISTTSTLGPIVSTTTKSSRSVMFTNYYHLLIFLILSSFKL